MDFYEMGGALVSGFLQVRDLRTVHIASQTLASGKLFFALQTLASEKVHIASQTLASEKVHFASQTLASGGFSAH